VFGRRRSILTVFVGLLAAAAATAIAVAGPAAADTQLTVGGGWQTFTFAGVGSGADQQPFTFTSPTPTTLKVTDCCLPGDTFAVYDNGTLIGNTDAVPVTGASCGNSDPDACYADPAISHGAFALAPGAHSITILTTTSPIGFGGGYLEVNGKAVVCTTTVTGTHSALAVTSGTTCVVDATITGGIAVTNGAQLVVTDSTVRGGIVSYGASYLQLCGSKAASINTTASTGFVLIGDPADGCAANIISGGLLATGNTGGGTIDGNTISGSWTITNNNPTFTATGNHH
jgi:hypothetical protein